MDNISAGKECQNADKETENGGSCGSASGLTAVTVSTISANTNGNTNRMSGKRKPTRMSKKRKTQLSHARHCKKNKLETISTAQELQNRSNDKLTHSVSQLKQQHSDSVSVTQQSVSDNNQVTATPNTVNKETTESNTEETLKSSASKRKLSYFSTSSTNDSSCDEIDHVDIVNEHDEQVNQNNHRKLLDSSENIIISVDKLKDISNSANCPFCGPESDLHTYAYDIKQGMAVLISLQCNCCGQELKNTMSCAQMKNRNSYETNRRASAAFTTLGARYAGYRKFSMIMNMPAMHEHTYYRNSKHVYDATHSAGQEHLQDAVKIVRQEYMTLDPTLGDNDIINITVTFDGSWQKRGHKSLFGVASVIDVHTGLVLDFHVMSKYCQECSSCKLTEGTPDYDKWMNAHKDKCNINFEGSSGAMEQEAGEVLWSRSIARNQMRYTTMLSDGDTKTFDHLCNLNIYGDDYPLNKEECINHVQKRMGAALRSKRLDCSKRKITLGGRGYGRLTDGAIKQLTTYYGKAVRNHVGDPKGMADAVNATLLHGQSTDDKPQHNLCPPGESSWCFFQRAIAKGETPGPHKEKVGTPLNETVAKEIAPVYERLSSEKLMKACSAGKTQNPNENLHSVIWNFLPKTKFMARAHVIAGVSLGIMTFNKGASALGDPLVHMGLDTGIQFEQQVQQMNKERITQGEAQAKKASKKERMKRKQSQVERDEQIAQREGQLYGPGIDTDSFTNDKQKKTKNSKKDKTQSKKKSPKKDKPKTHKKKSSKKDKPKTHKKKKSKKSKK